MHKKPPMNGIFTPSIGGFAEFKAQVRSGGARSCATMATCVAACQDVVMIIMIVDVITTHDNVKLS